MEDVGATIFYDDEDDCMDYECLHNNAEYDYDYMDMEKETLHELYQNCLSPSLYGTGYYLLPLLGSTILFRLFVLTRMILFSLYNLYYRTSLLLFVIKISLYYFRKIHIKLNISHIICNLRSVCYRVLCTRILSYSDSICFIILQYFIYAREMAWQCENFSPIFSDTCLLVCLLISNKFFLHIIY